MNPYKNKFLIAMPSINDPIFQKSLILMCDYGKDGAMGLIINKPIDDNMLMNVFSDFDMNKLYEHSKIYFGGPVGLDTCFVLHDSKYLSDDSLSLSKELSMTSNNQILNDIKNNKGPNKYMVTLGYAGWDKNQLDKEIKNGDWLVVPADNNFIFKISDDKKWDISCSHLGFDMNKLSGISGLT